MSPIVTIKKSFLISQLLPSIPDVTGRLLFFCENDVFWKSFKDI